MIQILTQNKEATAKKEKTVGKKIKVTQIARFAFPSIGGIETVISQICKGLSAANFEKEIICCSNSENSETKDEVKYKRCKYFWEFASNNFSLSFLWNLFFVKTDVLHYHMPFLFAAIAHFFMFPKYKKMVVTYHSDIIGYDKIMRPFWGIYDKFLARADKIHVLVLTPTIVENSRFLKKYKDKCVVIEHGIELVDKMPDVREIKSLYPNKKILLSVGRLVSYKGFIYALEAMKNVNDDCILFIIGDGPLRDELKAYIDNNNLNEKVKMLGRVSDEVLQKYYCACDIYVFPSTMRREAYGIVQLEAMRYAKPVINTHLGTGVNYVSVDNETGITVDPENPKQLADAINLLVKNDKLRLKLGQNARKRVEDKFSLDKINEKYTEFYESLV